MKTYRYKMTGLDCAACASNLEHEIEKLDGVSDVSISFMMEKLTFSCEESQKEEVMKRIRKVVSKNEPDVEIEEV